MVSAPLTAAAVASLNLRQAPVTATEAGLMVVEVEPMLCTPVQPGRLSLRPPCRSGISAFSCGGRTAAAASSTERIFASKMWLSLTWGLRPKSWPGNPCGCTLVGR